MGDVIEQGRGRLREVAGLLAELEVSTGIRIVPKSTEDGMRIRRFIRAMQVLGWVQHYREVRYADLDDIMGTLGEDMACWLRYTRGEEAAPAPGAVSQPPARDDARRTAVAAIREAAEISRGAGRGGDRTRILRLLATAEAALSKKKQPK